MWIFWELPLLVWLRLWCDCQHFYKRLPESIRSKSHTHTHTQPVFSGGQQRPRSANKPTTNRILNRNKTKKVVKCVNSMERMLPGSVERSIRYTRSEILPVPHFIERFVGRLRFLFHRSSCDFFFFFFFVHSTLHLNFNWSPSKSWKFIEAYGFSCSQCSSNWPSTNHFIIIVMNVSAAMCLCVGLVSRWSSSNCREWFIFSRVVVVDRWHRASQLSHLRELLVFDICSASTVAMRSQLPAAVLIRFVYSTVSPCDLFVRNEGDNGFSLCVVLKAVVPVRRYHFDCKLDARFIYCSVHRQNVFFASICPSMCAHYLDRFVFSMELDMPFSGW